MALKMFSEKSLSEKKAKVVLAIAAGKGGVGKSMLTAHLAYTLHSLGFSVGVLDADIYGPSIRKMLPEDQIPVQKGSLLTPASCKGIKYISMAYFRKNNDASILRAPIVNNIISQFIDNVSWGELDFLIIDFPPGTGDIHLSLAQKISINGAVIITTPQEVALNDVRKAINLFQKVNIPIIGIVENMSYYFHEETNEKLYLFGKGGGRTLSKEYHCPLLSEIPIDPEFSNCCDHGKKLEKESLIEQFLNLAQLLISKISNTNHLETLNNFELVWKEMG